MRAVQVVDESGVGGVRLLTVKEAAARLGVSKQYLYARRDDGTLPFTDLGTGSRPAFRVSEAALEAFVASRTEGVKL